MMNTLPRLRESRLDWECLLRVVRLTI